MMNNIFFQKDKMNIVPIKKFSTDTYDNDMVDTENIFKIIKQCEYIALKKSYLPLCIIKIIGSIIYQYLTQDKPINFIMKSLLNINENNLVLNYYELMRTENKTKILSSNSNCCVIFSILSNIREIISSYSQNKVFNITLNIKNNILHQIRLDFPRMIINFGREKVLTLAELYKKIDRFEKYSINIVQNVYWLILTLCTQASFYYLYSVLYELYTIEDLNLHILQDQSYPIINIIDNQSSLDIIFYKSFIYKDIGTHETVSIFNTFMVVVIDLQETNDGYIFYGKKYGIYKSCKMYWIKSTKLI